MTEIHVGKNAEYKTLREAEKKCEDIHLIYPKENIVIVLDYDGDNKCIYTT